MKKLKEVRASPISWPWLVIVSLIELPALYYTFAIMPLFLMLTMGEGSSSLLYTGFASLLWIAMPILIITGINIFLYNIGLETDNYDVARSVLMSEVVVVVIYIGFICYTGFIRGFHI